MKQPIWLFQAVNGLVIEALPIVMPFAAWQEAANHDVMYVKRS